jgi:hypothetical protein
MLAMNKRDFENLERPPSGFFKGFESQIRGNTSDVSPDMVFMREKWNEFGAEFNAALNSPYYWWWVFLRESEEYRAVSYKRKVKYKPSSRRALNKSKAAFDLEEEDPQVRAVVEDFGILDRSHFHSWWFSTGRYIFAQQHAFPEVKVVDDGFKVWKSKNIKRFYLEVPLTIRKSTALRQIKKILGDYFKAEDGGRHNVFAHSTAKREINKSSKMRLSTFKQFFDVWQDRQEHPDSKWWETGERLKISPAFINYPHTPKSLRASNNRNMTLTVQRIYRKTEKLIYFAARGDFPRTK